MIDKDVYRVLTLSLTDSVFKSFYCSCCRACDSKSSGCIFSVPNPILLDQEWIVLNNHSSTNSFLSYESFRDLLSIGKERMDHIYPKGVTLFHEGSLQPYTHPNAYLTTDVSFKLIPCLYTDIHNIYKIYSILSSYASLANHTVVWQCRWISSIPQIQFQMVDITKAPKERAFYSLNLSIQDGTKDSGKTLEALSSIPKNAYNAKIVVPDSLDIVYWNKAQTQTHQKELIDRLRSLRKMTSQTIELLGLYCVKLLQGQYRLESLRQEINNLKWPLFIRSTDQKKKDLNVRH
jgi:hypothetical protein